MPTYCYRTADHELIERQFAMGRAPKRLRLPDGRSADRSYQDERMGPRTTRRYAVNPWPMKSFAMGFHPSQREDAMKKYADAGIQTYIHPDGDVEIENRSHRNALLRFSGMYDKDAGYGDEAGKHVRTEADVPEYI